MIHFSKPESIILLKIREISLVPFHLYDYFIFTTDRKLLGMIYLLQGGQFWEFPG